MGTAVLTFQIGDSRLAGTIKPNTTLKVKQRDSDIAQNRKDPINLKKQNVLVERTKKVNKVVTHSSLPQIQLKMTESNVYFLYET